jgi:CRISPR-associated protein Cas8a1/Csx13
MLANNARKRIWKTLIFQESLIRIRSSLLRAKNLQTMRAEITDLLAKGGVNNGLQVNWPAVMPIIHGSDWQKTRDLALLALTSYSGDGVKDLESDNIIEEEEV